LLSPSASLLPQLSPEVDFFADLPATPPQPSASSPSLPHVSDPLSLDSSISSPISPPGTRQYYFDRDGDMRLVILDGYDMSDHSINLDDPRIQQNFYQDYRGGRAEYFAHMADNTVTWCIYNRDFVAFVGFDPWEIADQYHSNNIPEDFAVFVYFSSDFDVTPLRAISFTPTPPPT